MTVSTSANQSIMLGNGVTTSFSWSFNSGVPIGQSSSEASYTVIYTSPTGVETTLSSSSYTLSFTPAAAGSLWGNGGSLLYPLSGSPIANGSTLTLIRTFPLTQTTTISNQGDFSPQVIEEMGDTLAMQIQQVNNRTTQWRGTWLSGVVYNPGDIVQDGANGSGTNNFYLCLIGNTSGVWLTDLGAGDWSLSVQALLPTSNQTISLSGAVSGAGQTTIVTTAANTAANSVVGNPTAASATAVSIAIPLNSLLGRSTGTIATLTANLPLSIGASSISFVSQVLTASLSNDVSITTASTYYDAASIAQGTAGVWFVSANIPFTDTTAAVTNVSAKLWDGTTVIDSGASATNGAGNPASISLSGFITNPAGNLKISGTSGRSGSSKIPFNFTGNSKDSTITAFRIG